jgi:predicted house-cleaning noncanonical NTP pyrophosphatase (MazG superfamily)
MNLKKMLLSMAEAQADSMKSEVMEFIQSEEFEEKLAEKMDKAVNIPFVKDEKEKEFFRDVADVITDLIYGLVGGK